MSNLHAIDPDLMNGVLGGAETAKTMLEAACPTVESYDTSAACKKANQHYVDTLFAMARKSDAHAKLPPAKH